MLNRVEKIFNIRYFLLFIVLFNLALSSVLISDYFTGKLEWARIVSDYNLTQYFVSYSHEFLKRGLIATFFEYLSISVNTLNVFIVSYSVINLIFILLWQFSALVFKADDQKKIFIIYLLIFVCSPATAMQLGNDFGRLDSINSLLMISSIMIVLYAPIAWGFFAMTALSVMALLIHEIYLFTGLPLVLLVFWIRISSGNKNVKLFIISLIVILSVLFCIVLFGKADYPNTLSYLSNQTGFQVDTFPISVWTSSLSENVVFTFERLQQFKTWQSLVKDFAILFIYLVLYLLPFKNLNLSWSLKLVLLSPLAILPLFIVGVDFSRWIGLMIFNMFIAFLVVWYQVYQDEIKIKISKKYIYFVCFAMILGLTGPLGIT